MPRRNERWVDKKRNAGEMTRGDSTSPSASPVPGLLAEDERRRVATQFGVDDDQVVRDHAISHALAAIAGLATDDVVFFGGTALSRTLSTDARLSEDIDLIAQGDRNKIGDRIEEAITRDLRGTLGNVTFTPRIRDTRHAEPSVLRVGDTTVQIQLLAARGYPPWPTEIANIEQRYTDAPPARLRVLTRPAFVASKLSSWSDRGAPRDLYDLWALARARAFDSEAAALFARFGPFTSTSRVRFERIPTEAEWEAALGHQCVLAVSPHEATRVVTQALNAM